MMTIMLKNPSKPVAMDVHTLLCNITLTALQ